MLSFYFVDDLNAYLSCVECRQTYIIPSVITTTSSKAQGPNASLIKQKPCVYGTSCEPLLKPSMAVAVEGLVLHHFTLTVGTNESKVDPEAMREFLRFEES